MTAMTYARSRGTWGSLSLLLTVSVQASEVKGMPQTSTTTVVVLVLIFLILLAALILAWCHLNRVTEGKYHPRHLWSNDDGEEEHAGPAVRLMGAATGLWRTFHSWVMREASEEQEHLQEDGERIEMWQRDKEEMQDEEDAHSQQSQGNRSQQEMEDGDEDSSSSNGINSEDNTSSLKGQVLRDGTGVQEPEETEELNAGNSEALLYDLHAFSGSAVWQDESSQGAVRLDVTAL